MTFTCSRCNAPLLTGAVACPNCGLPFAQSVPAVSDAGQSVPQAYDIAAEKIGFVPNVKKRDNLYQAAAIGGTMVLGALVGVIVDHSLLGAGIGLLGGLIVGAFVSGFVLMIIGLRRK